MAHIKDRLGSGVFAIAAGALAVFMASELVNDAWQVLRYVKATGHVTAYTAPDPLAQEHSAGQLRFDYQVDGKTYQHVYPPMRGVPMAAPDLLQQPWKPGDTITVFYDPTAPQHSTLELRINPVPLGYLMFLSPFLVLGGYSAIRSPRPPDKRRRAKRRIQPEYSAVFITYAVLSTVTGFAYAILTYQSRSLGWQWAVVTGLLLWIIAVPSATWLIWMWTRPPSIARGGKHSQHEQRTTVILLASVCLAWWAFILLVVPETLWYFGERIYASYAYDALTGQVIRTAVLKSPGGGGRRSRTTYTPVIVYQYSVGGTTYQSERLTFGLFPMSGSPTWAQDWVATHPKGSAVTVYYDRHWPHRSVLDTSVSPTRWIIGLVIVPVITGVGVLLLRASWREVRLAKPQV